MSSKKTIAPRLVLTLLFFAYLLTLSGVAKAQAKRKIAVTIDDLPVVTIFDDIKVRRQITDDLLKHITDARIPVVGFVNEGKLYRGGTLSADEVDLLLRWLAAGLELGNHTYSHMSLNGNPVADFIADAERGETVTKRLLAKKGMNLRYFRHPYLHTGLDMETKAAVASFLKDHGYTVAPVTVDDSDWIFASAYDKTKQKGDLKLRKQIAAAYIPYLESKLDYFERQSMSLFGRDVSQTLLLHANSINAALFGDVVKLLRRRGYEIVTLDEALKDEAYSQPETFTGKAGISWLHRWAIAKGKENILPDEPRVPGFVMKASGFDSE
jgi:peptidoglycan/xylan/chitin deacetylase (PgdA/CDA1 family)